MKFIYIKGVHFENKGAELMMLSIISLLKANDDVRIVLAPRNVSTYEQRRNLGTYQYFDLVFKWFDFNFISYFFPKKLRSFFVSYFGIVFEKDVDVILDASGYAYGDKWSIKDLRRCCSQLYRLSKYKKNYVFMPQMFGPFENEKKIKLVSNYFKKAKVIFARDSISYDLMKGFLHNYDALYQAPDFTNLYDLTDPVSRNESKLLVIPNSNMISGRANHADWMVKYLNIIEDVIKAALLKNMQVIVLNHEGKSDHALCLKIASNFVGKVEVKEGLNAMEIKKEIAESKIVFSSRFHGCVSALSQGITCIGTSWSHKYEELYADYGVSDLLISDPNAIKDVSGYYNSVLLRMPEIEKSLLEKSHEIKLSSKESWEFISRKLDL